MPQKMWKHTCPEDGWFGMGTPFCSRCEGPGEYDGWQYSMHEAMAGYQSLYELKPIGPHRRMADELFNDATVKCEACGGRGLHDINEGASYERCGACRGFGMLFSKPAEEIAEIRRLVLDAFPDAAADPVPEFATAPLALDLSQSKIVDLSATWAEGTGVAAQELGYIEEVLGSWNVKYPGPDGMITEGYVERLELRRDGTYSWNPSPAWAVTTGKWEVVKTQDGGQRLCFEEKQGRLRCNYLVLMPLEKGVPFFLNWQRTRGDAVIFADRIFRANRPKNWAPNR